MERAGLRIKQEPRDPEDTPFPDGASEPLSSGELSAGRPLRSSGNGLLPGNAKEPAVILMGGRKYSDHCEERASRPGKSRIPGRDHRRYYHEHWRAEYLMDFNAARHGMICMVCGSSLATLKLSTIKRHIRQKHPYSLAWSAHEKEAIMSSWDAHLGLEAEAEAADPADTLQGNHGELSFSGGRRRRRGLGPLSAHGGRRSSGLAVKASSEGETRNLEQYLKESLQSWFQSEFLMDYDLQGNRLFCMMCGSSLPSLNLDDIKHHVMEAHPSSLGFGPSEKATILEAWNSRTAEGRSAGEAPVEGDVIPAPQDLTVKEIDPSLSPEGPAGEDGSEEAGPWDSEGGSPPVPARGRDHRRYFQEHWRVEYLMDYNGLRHGLVCMVCGSSLATLKMSTIKRHIQQKHPDSTQLSHHVKALIVQEWNQKVSRLADADGALPEAEADAGDGQPQHPRKSPSFPEEMQEHTGAAAGDEEDEEEEEEEVPAAGRLAPSQPSPEAASPAASAPSRRGQRRNYQPRWRQEYLMDYDEQRHGLLCLVCGGTLATLKVSTIKRHILQVHRFSLEYTELEKQTILDAYSENEQPQHPKPPSLKGAPGPGPAPEPRDVKPNIQGAGEMALAYQLPVCTA